MALCRAGGRKDFDNAADCFVSPTRATICTRSAVRGACRHSLTAVVDAVMELWALPVHGLTSGVCCVVQSLPTAWLRSLAAETNDMDLGTTPRSIERSIRLCRRPCVRLLPQTALLGQPSPAPTRVWCGTGPDGAAICSRSRVGCSCTLSSRVDERLLGLLAGCPRLGTRLASALSHNPLNTLEALGIRLYPANKTANQHFSASPR